MERYWVRSSVRSMGFQMPTLIAVDLRRTNTAVQMTSKLICSNTLGINEDLTNSIECKSVLIIWRRGNKSFSHLRSDRKYSFLYGDHSFAVLV
jgi:hypothetical protein